MRAARRRRTSAQSMVEFALIAPMFFMLVFGTIELGRLMWIDHTLANATREGARYAMVHGSESTTPATQAAVAAVVTGKATGVNGPITVTGTNLGGDVGETVTISTSHTFNFIVSEVIGRGSLTLNHSSTVIIQH